MNKRIVLMLLVLVNLLLFSSCDEIGDGGSRVGGILVSEDKKADARMEQIISAIKDNDREALKSLFSKKALDKANDIDNGIDYLFDFLKGDIDSWEIDSWASDESIRYGKKSLMIRSGYKVITNEEEYFFYVVDYNVDTINPDNAGVYMMQVTTWADSDNLGSWQERLCAGIYKPEQ